VIDRRTLVGTFALVTLAGLPPRRVPALEYRHVI
jgi:hypothetical protein